VHTSTRTLLRRRQDQLAVKSTLSLKKKSVPELNDQSLYILPYVHLLYYVCIDILTLDAGLLARSQYPEGPATGHLDTDFLGFPVSTSEC